MKHTVVWLPAAEQELAEIWLAAEDRAAVSHDEVESALRDEATTFDVSRSSGRPIAFGFTDTGRFIAVVFEVMNLSDPLIIRPITAYEVPEP